MRFRRRDAAETGDAPAPRDSRGALTFDGREIPVLPGRTVAAALWAADVVVWRTTRGGGEPRGVFCGIGVCFDCLVVVNGRPGQRACLVPARDGDVVRTQEGTGHDD